jgi:2-keto-4-pentenoate hydratase/2-oxohepta-3-ene-1,7-dioic acid hydratase in catechol pathway
MKPPRYLAVGDRVRVEIGGLGAIEHSIISAPPLGP